VKNPFYTGQMRWKQQLFQGNHPAIVTVKQWDRANEALRSPVHGGMIYPPKENLAFWGLLTCAKCGCSVVGETKKAGRYVYYRCTHGRGDCDEGYVRAEALDAQFRELVARVRVDDEIAEKVKQGLRESLDDETAYHVEEVTKLTQQLDQIRRWKDKCYEDRLEGRLAEDFWVRKMNEFQMEEARIISGIAAHKAAENKYYEQGCVTLELAQRAETMWDSLSAPRKRQLLQILLSNSTLSGGRVEAAYRQPFDLLAELAAARTQKNPGSDLSEPGSYMWRGWLARYRRDADGFSWVTESRQLLTATG
jgi:hypothetical protein